MAEITFERGRKLTYPNFYPKLTFTPIFGRNEDFIWIEEVRGAWPEHDSEFVFVRSTVHDERVDRLKEENEKLRELAKKMHVQIKETCDVCDGPYCDNFDAENECCVFDTLMRECGIEPEL